MSLQVINAALALAAKPQSKLAQENMDPFKERWEKQVRVLTDAVNDITSIDDFLAVSENHILEDMNKCIIAPPRERCGWAGPHSWCN